MIFPLTVNMKCFEISTARLGSKLAEKLTVNMKCFEIINYDLNCEGNRALTVNMKCFEIQINQLLFL